MNCKTCTKCGATWMNGQLFWKTGQAGKDEDLAGLVCNNLTEDTELCVNPARGSTTGTTWEYRRGYIDGALEQAMKQEKTDGN